MVKLTDFVYRSCGISILVLEILLPLSTHFNKRLYVSMGDADISSIRSHGSSMLGLGIVLYLSHPLSISLWNRTQILSLEPSIAADCFYR
jgi:uncharacterized membrane protein YdcZ (DUF606 family)